MTLGGRPYWLVRRFVLAPAVIGLTAVLWLFLPLWVIGAAALSPIAAKVLPGQWRPLRILWLAIVYLTAESLLLAVMFGLWVSSGFGWKLRTPYFAGIHYELAEGVLVLFFQEARRVLRLKIVTQGDGPDRASQRPVLVCCRHAGPGDSFTLMYALLHWFAREPRVVLKDTMGWDPAIDVLLTRIPSKFIAPTPKSGAAGDALLEQIGQLAADLDSNDALVIFPEGGNFTPERRQRAIDKLRSLGLETMAERAEQMTEVLAPRPGGLLAALDAAPEADVLMVAHTGLDHLRTITDVWRELPMDKQLVMKWWEVPRAEIPANRDARIDWLFDWWAQIDQWVAEHKPRELTPSERKRAGRLR